MFHRNGLWIVNNRLIRKDVIKDIGSLKKNSYRLLNLVFSIFGSNQVKLDLLKLTLKKRCDQFFLISIDLPTYFSIEFLKVPTL